MAVTYPLFPRLFGRLSDRDNVGVEEPLCDSGEDGRWMGDSQIASGALSGRWRRAGAGAVGG